MTPDKWAAMQTAANQADSREWIVAVGWGALVVFIAAWCVLAVVWWRNEKARRSKRATFEGADVEMSEPIDNEWNVGQDDPFDHYPWTWTAWPDDDGGPDPTVGSISTPNGRRPDGTMHTAWLVAGEIWEPIGHLICHLVNEWAQDRFGTPVPPPEVPRRER